MSCEGSTTTTSSPSSSVSSQSSFDSCRSIKGSSSFSSGNSLVPSSSVSSSSLSSSQKFGNGSNNGSGSSVDSNEKFCTPVRYLNNRIAAGLKNGDEQEPRSPLLRVPASPAMQRLGYGTGVGVFLLERSPRAGIPQSPWAIKKICKIRRDQKEVYEARLEYEASILKGLTHPNIVGYRGYGHPSTDVTFLAMEKASKSLADLIEERVEELTPLMDISPFPAEEIHKVALNVAKALNYLHNQKKLIHGDLKSGNVLIFGEFEAVKICDFGVVRRLKEDGTVDGRYVGTEIWNPIEVILRNRGQKKIPITCKADIYPYGLTLHEMISLKPPHFSTAEEEYSAASGTNESEVEFDEEAFDVALQKRLGRRPALPDFEFDESYSCILRVFYCCTAEEPAERPSAEQILTMLEESQWVSD